MSDVGGFVSESEEGGNVERPLQNLPKIVTSGRVLKTLSHCDNRHD